MSRNVTSPRSASSIMSHHDKFQCTVSGAVLISDFNQLYRNPY